MNRRSDRDTSNDTAHDEGGLSATFAEVPLERREVLVTVGAVTAAPTVTSSGAVAVEHGYGTGAYGDESFDGSSSNGTEEEAILAVRTHDVTGVDASPATLHDDLTRLPEDDAGTVYFEWGEPGSLSKTTTERTLTSPDEFDAILTDFGSGVEYDFHSVAEADGDAKVGDTLTFTAERGGASGTVPRIVRLWAEDSSDPGSPHADVHVEWAASFGDGTLDSAELTLSDSTHAVHSRTYDLGGPSADRSERVRVRDGGRETCYARETYAVELTVRSERCTAETERTTFNAA